MNDRNDLVFIITVRAERVFSGASVVLDLQVENHSKRTVAFPNPAFPSSPQPVYRLKRPDGQELELTPANMAGNGGASSEAGAVSLVTLEADQGWYGDMSLDQFADLSQPGMYELNGCIIWNDVTVEAEPITFTVLATNPEELSISLGIDDDGSLFCEAMLLQRSPDTLEAVAAILKEVDPRLGEMSVSNYLPRGALPRSTQAVLGPYANYCDLVLRWMVAVTAEGLYVAHNTGAEVCHVACDQKIAMALTPLVRRDRSLTMLVVSTGPEPGLWYTRIGKPVDMPATASLTRIADLTSPPMSATAILGAEVLGSPLLVVTTSNNDGGTTLDVHRVADDGSTRKETRHLENLRALPGVGAHVDANGHMRVGFIATLPEEPEQPEQPEQLVLVEVHGELNGALLEEPRIGSPFEADSITGDVLVRYYERSPGDTRRAVAYQTKDNALFVLGDDDHPRAAYSELPKFARWGIAPGRDTWYVVFTLVGGVTAGPL